MGLYYKKNMNINNLLIGVNCLAIKAPSYRISGIYLIRETVLCKGAISLSMYNLHET